MLLTMRLTMFKINPVADYNPLFFLASLGAGGLSISFFMYPMFMIQHPDTPMVTFNHIYIVLTGSNLLAIILLNLDLLFILFFAFIHFYLLIWNIKQYIQFTKTEAFQTLTTSHKEIRLMAIPLTLAMSINVSFVLGAVFIPNLWSVVEFLFPLAILGFFLTGLYALKFLANYFTKLFTQGGFEFESNNNLSPMITIFALAMIGVGFAAPGAMSHHIYINAIALVLSIFFFTIAILLSIIKIVLGFHAMLKHGISVNSSSSLWIVIPIMTLFGITIIRYNFGLHHQFDHPLTTSHLFVLTTIILSIQVLFGLLGYIVMKKLGYFRKYIDGNQGDAGTFSIICPGVAFFVFGVFFITFGLVKTSIISHLSIAYFIILLPFIVVQSKTVIIFFRLYRKILMPSENLN